ncbi:hypothetical protein GCM10011386_09950 [Parapedobacter defluvii]|uniref:Uncharacterized protein n=1 Tax=Parapedobacter defluvii TaxID=2045106 RepID=A0ABQ1L8V3_9SPHI|nr:hypothetical protein GCM10011386_09950 [Parapedobacter defluvii]
MIKYYLKPNLALKSELYEYRAKSVILGDIVSTKPVVLNRSRYTFEKTAIINGHNSPYFILAWPLLL